MRTSVLHVFTTPSSLMSQSGEQPEGPSLGTLVARALCGHHRARSADEVRAAQRALWIAGRWAKPRWKSAPGATCGWGQVTREHHKATKAETHHPAPCTRAKRCLHSTAHRFLTQTPLLLRSVPLQGQADALVF